MPIESSNVRKVAVWIAVSVGSLFIGGVLLSAIAYPLLFQTLQDHGVLKTPEAWMWSMIIDLLRFLASKWSYMLAGLVGGFALGVWLNAFLSHKKNDELLEDGHLETMLRIERDKSAPYQWHAVNKKNVYLFFQIWNPKPTVTIKEYLPAPSWNINIPDLYPVAPDLDVTPEQLDTFFIVFEKPISYQRVHIESFGHLFPKHDTYAATNRTIILYLREQLPPTMTTFEIRFEALESAT